MEKVILTDAQLAEAKSQMENGTRILSWLKEKQIAGMFPKDVVSQLREKYGDQEVNNSLSKLKSSAMGERISMIVAGILSRENVDSDTCENLISILQDCVTMVSAKKAEIQG